MIPIAISNPSFDSCSKCIHSDDSEEICILRRCIHAVSQLEECYVPKPQVVQCKDCKHYDGRPCGKVDWYNSADDYCSMAERKNR